jgi:hypothetical protein
MALAAEVRLLAEVTTKGPKRLSAMVKRRTSGAKALISFNRYGTTEAVPFVQRRLSIPELTPQCIRCIHNNDFRSRIRAVSTTPVSLLCSVSGNASTFHTHASPFRGKFNNPR